MIPLILLFGGSGGFLMGDEFWRFFYIPIFFVAIGTLVGLTGGILSLIYQYSKNTDKTKSSNDFASILCYLGFIGGICLLYWAFQMYQEGQRKVFYSYNIYKQVLWPNPALNSDAAATKSSSPSVFVITHLQQSFR